MSGPESALVALLRCGGTVALLLTVVLTWRRPRLVWWLTVILAPISFPVGTGIGGSRITIPLEGLLVVWLGARLLRGQLPWPLLLRPVALAFLGHVGAMTIATAGGVEPTVSLKALAIRILYGSVLLLGGLEALAPSASGGSSAPPWVAVGLAYAAGLLPVLAGSIVRHAARGFEKQAAYEIAAPFFSNRLELTAVVVMLLPLLAGSLAYVRGRAPRLLAVVVVLLGLGSLVTLSSRSAWASLGASLAMALLASRRLPARPLLALVALLAGVACTIAVVLASHRALERRPGAGLHLEMPGVAALLAPRSRSDLSLLERGNRLICALRMGAARPVAGYGPGSYEGTYGAFQHPWELTMGSTYGGDLGDAHSDLAGAFAEQGLLGLVALLVLYLTILHVALQRCEEGDLRAALPPLAAASAFVANSVVNSMLDFDAVTPLFWIIAAAIQAGALRPGATTAAAR